LNQANAELPGELQKLEAADTQVLVLAWTPFAMPMGGKNQRTFPLLSDWGGESPANMGVR